MANQEEWEVDSEDLADEARDKEVERIRDKMKQQYKTFYGTFPDEELPIVDIQEAIRIMMPRPYKL